MAQKARLISILANGMVDSTGTAVASGYARFYQPGTTTPITVYSDEDGSVTQSQPVTLDAGGRAEVYALVPCRVIVKKSDDTTTVFDGNPPYVTAQQVSIFNTEVNAGVETTLDSWFSSGYKESGSATGRSISDWLSDAWVSVKDFGALGDGAQNDTTYIQAAMDRCATTGKTLFFPAGTYLINTALTPCSGGSRKYSIRGAGQNESVIRQSSTSANGLTFSFGGATDYRACVSDLRVEAATTSSGSAISLSNANGMRFERVETALFRTGFNTASATGTRLEKCTVASTDSNAAATGVSCGNQTTVCASTLTGSANVGTGISGSGTDVLVTDGTTVSGFLTQVSISGAGARVTDCNLTAASATNGATLSGANSRIADCRVTGSSSTTGITLSSTASVAATNIVSGCATGISITGQYSGATDNTVSGSSGTTGLSLGAATTYARGNSVTGFTTGILVGAVADCTVTNNRLYTNTTDISINSSATGLQEFGNIYTTISDSTGLSHGPALYGRRLRASYTATTVSGASTSATPVFSGSGFLHFNLIEATHSGSSTLTVNNPSYTGAQDGDILIVRISAANGAGGAVSITLGSDYAGYTTVDGSTNNNAILSGNGSTTSSLNAGRSALMMYVYRPAATRKLQQLFFSFTS